MNRGDRVAVVDCEDLGPKYTGFVTFAYSTGPWVQVQWDDGRLESIKTEKLVLIEAVPR